MQKDSVNPKNQALKLKPKKISIPYTPHPAQQLVHNSDKRFRAIAAGRKFGKTTMCSAEGFKYLGKPNAMVWWVAPYQDVAMIGWRRFLTMIPNQLIARQSIKSKVIQTINNSSIYFKTADNPSCYDDQTEILTNEGWKLFKDLNQNELVFTMNPETKMGEWQKPIVYIEDYYNGKMFHIKSKAIDLLITPNHNEPKFIRGTNKIKLTKIKNISQYDSKPHKCVWKNNKEFNDIWIKFLGIYLAGGSATNKGNGNYVVTISQFKQKYMNKIWNLLKEMPQNWRRINSGFECNSKELFEKLKPLGYCYEKYIPQKYMDISRRQIEFLLKWFRMGDGSLHKGQNIYYTTSKKLADQLQELILKKGNMAIIKSRPPGISNLVKGKRISYIIRERTSEKLYYGSTNKGSYITNTNYSGKVYCVTVPNHVIYVRRNGIPCWSGNSLVGEGLDLLILDEVARIREKVWFETLRPNLDDPQHFGHCLMISTPMGYNWFYECFMEGQKDDTSWQSWRYNIDGMDELGGFPSWVNPYIKPENIREAAKLPERVFQQEYLARYLQDLGAVFRNVLGAVNDDRGFEDPLDGFEYVAGVDWGRANDYTVVTIIDVDTGHMVAYDRFRKASWNLQVKRVARILHKYNARALCDSTGLGDPLQEMLNNEYSDAHPFKITNPKKGDIVENLALMIEDRDITYPDIPNLIEELSMFGMKQTSTSIKYQAPRGYHDDFVVSLALAGWQLRKAVKDIGYDFLTI